MHPYRCKECTLFRCDADDQACWECQPPAALPDTKYTFGIDAKGWFVFGAGGGGGQAGQAPQAVPVGAPAQQSPVKATAYANSTASIVSGLYSMPVDVAADVVKGWLLSAFPWHLSQKGDRFWETFHDELRRISLGGAP